MEDRHTIGELAQWQALPLTIKLQMTKARIRGWVDEYGLEGVYVSFSGGKDSTVLLDICRKMYPDMKAAFVDTGLEYPEIREFVKTYSNVDWLKPSMNFKKVIETYGYPMISKEVSESVQGAKKYLTSILNSRTVLTDRQTDRQTDSISIATSTTRLLAKANTQSLARMSGGGTTTSIENSQELASILNERMIARSGGANQRLALMLGMLTKNKKQPIKANIPKKDRSAFSQEKYKFLLFAPFDVSNKCCNVMKKGPAHKYLRETGRFPITAQMAAESRLRTQKWLQNGCNGFNLKYPTSNPMAFWTSEDCLLYIRLNNLPIASVYGEIVTEDEMTGQTTLFPYDAEKESKLFAPERTPLFTTGCDRTGCIFCGFGCHLEKPGEGRFERLKETHPQLHKYLFDDGRYKYKIINADGSEIDVRRVDREILERWVEQNENNPRFHIDKTYVPDKGLGYKHIIDWINENGNFDIKY